MKSEIKLLIIEDEESIYQFLKVGLTYEGYKVDVATNGEKSIELFKNNAYSLVILDLILPDFDGLKLCKYFRELDKTVPIIILTARKEINVKLKGFDCGADDYITKPFSYEELLARIKVWLKRTGKFNNSAILKSGEIKIDLLRKEVRVKNNLINLTPKEYDLLVYFMKNPEIVFSKKQLLYNIWGLEFEPETNFIEVHISHLREKLGDKEHKLIKTVYGMGYRFSTKKIIK